MAGPSGTVHSRKRLISTHYTAVHELIFCFPVTPFKNPFPEVGKSLLAELRSNALLAARRDGATAGSLKRPNSVGRSHPLKRNVGAGEAVKKHKNSVQDEKSV